MSLFPAPYIWTISLWQPWASLLFTDPRTKTDETRHWILPAHLIGQTALVHAAKHRVGELHPDLERLCWNVLGGHDWRRIVPFGKAIGTLTMTGCRSTNAYQPQQAANLLCGDFSPCRFAWATEDAHRLPSPIPMVGRQGFWKVPREDLVAAA